MSKFRVWQNCSDRSLIGLLYTVGPRLSLSKYNSGTFHHSLKRSMFISSFVRFFSQQTINCFTWWNFYVIFPGFYWQMQQQCYLLSPIIEESRYVYKAIQYYYSCWLGDWSLSMVTLSPFTQLGWLVILVQRHRLKAYTWATVLYCPQWVLYLFKKILFVVSKVLLTSWPVGWLVKVWFMTSKVHFSPVILPTQCSLINITVLLTTSNLIDFIV